jgi:hypothetical protein
MTTTFQEYFDKPARPIHKPPRPPKKPLKLRGFEPDKDIMLWLRGNAPRNWQELKDLRYCLYHRCSRAGFKVKKYTKDHFTLAGRASSVIIVSNNARHFLLWQLRILAWEEGWVGRGKVRIDPLVGRCF